MMRLVFRLIINDVAVDHPTLACKHFLEAGKSGFEMPDSGLGSIFSSNTDTETYSATREEPIMKRSNSTPGLATLHFKKRSKIPGLILTVSVWLGLINAGYAQEI